MPRTSFFTLATLQVRIPMMANTVPGSLATFWRRTGYHPAVQHDTARYKLGSAQQQDGIKLYLAKQGRTGTHAFRERHPKHREGPY